MSATDSPHQSVLQAVSSELDNFLVGLFDTPPTGCCSNETEHTIREGQYVYLAITVNEDSGMAEPRCIYCQQCGHPKPESINADDWVAICDGYAVPEDSGSEIGECLVLTDTEIRGVYPVTTSNETRTDELGNPRSK